MDTAFRSPNAEDASSHFFVEKYPIFVSEDSSVSPVATFCFIDEGALTNARFEGFLKKYGRLFARLPRFEVIYVAACEAVFAAATKTFQHVFLRLGPVRLPGAGAWEEGRLFEHFRQRHLYETGRFESFDRATLVRLRNEREEFSGRFFDALYGVWKAGGDEAVRSSLASQGPVPDLSRARFSTYLLKGSYDIFGTFVDPDEL